MSPTMVDRLKSLPLTMVLTVLIWMYAEAKFTATRENVSLTIKPVSPTGDMVLSAFDPGEKRFQGTVNVAVTLEGPTNQIDRIYQESVGTVAADEDFSPLGYVPPAEGLKAGTDNEVDTVAALNSLAYFRRRGVTVTSAKPARIRVEADPLSQVVRPVDFHPAFAVDHFTATPEQVTVKIPTALLAESGGADRIGVTAVPVRELTTLTPGVQQTVAVRYVVEYADGERPERDDRISVTPAQGMVVMSLPRRQQETAVLPAVPVWVSGPPAVLGKYEVSVKPGALRVSVTGSEAAVKALREQMAAGRGTADMTGGIRAYLDIAATDGPGVMLHRQVRFMLPDGLTVQAGGDDVDFKLTERLPTTRPG
jgi:hypothetical protein